MKTNTKAPKKKKPAAAKFIALTPAQKRVAIARDVIAGLEAKRLIAMPGTYLFIDDQAKRVSKSDIKKRVGLKEKLTNVATCEVCALGAIFVAAVDRFNGVICNDRLGLMKEYGHELDWQEPDAGHVNVDTMRDNLKAYFDAGELQRIEDAFEWRWRTNSLSDDSACMKTIMENIIRNRGTFKIDQVPA